SASAGSTSRYRAGCYGSPSSRAGVPRGSPRQVSAIFSREEQTSAAVSPAGSKPGRRSKLELEAHADVIRRAAELDAVRVGVEMLRLDQHEAARIHRAAAARRGCAR